MLSFRLSGFAAPSLPSAIPAPKRHRYLNPSILNSLPKCIPALHLSLNSLPFEHRVSVACASNSNLSGKEKSDDSTSSDSDYVAQGPPLLTILAGFGVFLIVLWLIKLIVVWFVGLIVKLASSN